MSDAGPGDFLEAVKESGAPSLGMPHVSPGALVCVSWVSPLFGHCSGCGLFKRGLRLTIDAAPTPENSDYNRCICAFKPIYRPKADIIETLKQPVSVPEKELA